MAFALRRHRFLAQLGIAILAGMLAFQKGENLRPGLKADGEK